MNNIKFYEILLICLFQIVAIQQIYACPADEKSLKKADEIWERAINAKGGREKILNIENILHNNKNEKLKSVSLTVFPDKFWTWKEKAAPTERFISVYDFSKNVGYGIIKQKRKPIILSPKLELKEGYLLLSILNLLETKWIRPKLIGSEITKINGEEVDLVCTEISFKYGEESEVTKIWTDFLFDRTTNLLTRTNTYFDESEINIETDYSNYSDVKGIKFASKIATKFGKDTVFFDGVVEVNVEFRKDLFDKPLSNNEGANSWKVKNKKLKN